MPISLMPLPYGADALDPVISARTLEFHHGKHHQAYVDKTNAAIAEGPLASASLEEIVAAARKDNNAGLFNNAAQTWNHGFYWASLKPGGSAPAGELKSALERDFGSVEAFNTELAARGAAHFGSGWVWLAEKDGKLSIEDSHDADTLADGSANPLLVLDVWEHAYYLDRQNARPAYLDAVIGGLLNWDFAAENFARKSVWTYPA